MAKKRVNTKLLTVLVVGFIAVTGGLAVAWAIGLGRTTVPELVADAEAAEAAQASPATIVGFYGRAAARAKTDLGLFMKVVEYAPAAAAEDEEWYARGQAAIRQALEVDPTHLPALRAQLAVDARGSRDLLDRGYVAVPYLQRVVENADKLLAAEPESVEGRLQKGRALMIRANTDPQGSTAEAEAEAEQLLAPLAEGGEPDVRGRAALYLTQLRGRIAARQRPYDEQAAAETYAAAAAAVDALAQDHPDDPAVQTRVHDARLTLGQTAGMLGRADEAQAQLDLAGEAVERAAGLATPDDAIYAEARLAAARYRSGRGDRDAAIELLRAAGEAAPADLALRRTLAESYIDAGEPEKALALLRTPAPNPAPDAYVGRDALDRRLVEVNEEGIEAEALIRQAADAQGAARDAAAEAAERQLGRYAATIDRTPQIGVPSASHPNVARLRGELRLAQGRAGEAIAELEKARQRMGGRQANTRAGRSVLLSLFRANAQLEQTGPARRALDELLQQNPGLHQIRYELARLLQRENQLVEAKKQIELALESDPGNATYQSALVRINSRLNGGGGGGDTGYAALPESTQRERMAKRAAAAELGDEAELLRLSRALAEAEPEREDLAVDLARVTAGGGDKDAAVAQLRAFTAANPDAGRAATVLESLTSTREDFLENNLQDYQKLLLEAQELRADGDDPAALAKLRAAAEAAPEGLAKRRVRQVLAAELIRRDDFDAAEAVVAEAEADADDPLGGKLMRVGLLIERGEVARAADVAQELRDALPYDFRSKLAYAKVLQSRGRLAEAASEYQGVLELQPFNADALRGLVQVNLARGRTDEAKTYVDEARRLMPDDPGFRELAAEYELRYGDPANVLPDRRRQVERNPEAPARG